jgi:hypothetical protein
MSATDMEQLIEIAEAIDQAAQARLARAAGLVRRLQDEIASLGTDLDVDPALLSQPGALQAAARHHAWTCGQRRRLLGHLAELRADLEAAHLAATQSFGHLSALRDLTAEAYTKVRRDRLKRALALASATDPSSARRLGT